MHVGIGLRTPHYDDWLRGANAAPPAVEAITENVLGRGGRPPAVVERVRASSDLFLHGVSLSIGSTDPLDRAYLGELRALVRRFEPRFVSDHLSFGKVDGVFGHDLWPLPWTDETLAHVVERVAIVQDVLGRRIALENVSSYVRFREASFDEAAFLAEVSRRADCLLLVDVNNVVVSSHNHGFDAHAYLRALPKERVAYMHVAGHSVRDGYRFDDHGSLPDDEVTSLLAEAASLFGSDTPCIFEWDENFPDLEGYLRAASNLGDAP